MIVGVNDHHVLARSHLHAEIAGRRQTTIGSPLHERPPEIRVLLKGGCGHPHRIIS